MNYSLIRNSGVKKRRPLRWKTWINHSLLALVVTVFMTPLVLALIVSMKTPLEFATSMFALPGSIPVAIYFQQAIAMNYFRLIANTVLITGLSCILTILLASLAAYPLARVVSRWTGAINQLFMLGLTLPFFVALIPLYLFARDLGILNTIHGIVLVYTALNMPFSIFFITSFIRALPKEIEESASIDGCTPITAFRFIILPLIRPVNATLAMFITLGVWNDLLLPLLFFSNAENGTITPAVYSNVGQFSTDYTALLRAAVLSSLPLLIFFFTLQKQIIAGIAEGAVKG
jgi:raffinose/stachyose/melibiose transport system permease protein